MLASFEVLGPSVISGDFCWLLKDTFRDHPAIVHAMQTRCPSLSFKKYSQKATSQNETRFSYLELQVLTWCDKS